MKYSLCFLIIFTLLSFSQDNRIRFFPKTKEFVDKIPEKENVWVFILAGQSNMAGRALVEPQDTLSNPRIMTINSKGQLILAKEPLHFQEPSSEGLDCGLSFGRKMIEQIPPNINILIIPTAIGGSSVSQWLGDSLFRNVKLLSNFCEKIEIGEKYGRIKGILWHQGESDAHPNDIPQYEEKLTLLFKNFRSCAGNKSLPIIMGELGPFSKSYGDRLKINKIMKNYSSKDKNSAVVSTIGLKDKGANVHFDSAGQRLLGKRYADVFLGLISRGKID